MIFIDTSVLVPATTASDRRHEDCLEALAAAEKSGGGCALHSIAELFHVLSGRPLPLRMRPDDAAKVIAHTAKRFTTIALSASEYLQTVEGLAGMGHSGGMIYDALILACARKAKAVKIYTLNAKHFTLIAPDLKARIVEP